MMYNVWLAWQNIRTHLVQSAVSVLVVALALGLSIAVFALGDGVRAGIIRASDPFGVLVVGAKGSAQQLVINTLLLQDVPVGNIPYEIYQELTEDPRARLVVPMAKGDNVGGAPIIGTDLSFFELRTAVNAPPAFQIAAGRLFAEPETDEHDEHEHEGEEAAHADNEEHEEHEAEEAAHADDEEHEEHEHEGEEAAHADGEEHDEHEHDEHEHDEETFEAVLGSEAASQLGLGIGDTFRSAHGSSATVLESEIHEEIYEVVGILQPSQTPYDAAVLTPIQSIWHAHADHDEEEETPGLIVLDEAAGEDAVTAVLVQPVGFVEANSIWQDFYVGTEAQAAFPGAELGALFDLLGQAERVLNGVGNLVLVVAALTVFLSIYSATLARQQSIAIMRSLGGSRWHVFFMVIIESLIVTVSGALVARLLGYGSAAIIANIFTTRSAIPIPIRFLTDIEPVLWLLTLLVAVLAGILPAMMAYRVNVVEKLFPT